jgi:hypothetical protein
MLTMPENKKNGGQSAKRGYRPYWLLSVFAAPLALLAALYIDLEGAIRVPVGMLDIPFLLGFVAGVSIITCVGMPISDIKKGCLYVITGSGKCRTSHVCALRLCSLGMLSASLTGLFLFLGRITRACATRSSEEGLPVIISWSLTPIVLSVLLVAIVLTVMFRIQSRGCGS